jgi:DNA-binding response OmpR family regulator
MNREANEDLRGTPEETISVLAVVAAKEAAELERTFSHTRWELRLAHSVREAKKPILSQAAGVIICEQQLPDGTWLDLMRLTEPLHPRPQVIVLSASMDRRLWTDVLDAGGYDVLGTPLQPRELYALVPMAWARWSDEALKVS